MRMATRDQVYGSVSSLVVRPSDSGGGGGGGNANANAIANEYEPGEIRRDEPRHRHSSSYYDRDRDRERERERDRERGRERERDRERFTPPGYNMKGYKGSVPTGSASPIHQRKVDPYEHDYDRNSRDFDRGVLEFDSSARDFGRDFDYAGPARGRGFRGGRGRGRFRERTPPAMGRGRAPFGRGFSGPGYVPEPLRGETAARNNPNVAPRVGDWICSEPTCGNLNFARRTHCNNCHKPRKDIAPFNIGVLSPGRGFHGPPLPLMDIPPMGRGMGRGGNGFRAPPVRWGRGGPREFDQLPPPRPAGRFSPPRPGGRFSPPRPPERFSDFRPGRVIRDRPDFRENDDYRDRDKYGRAPPGDWEFSLDSRDRERDDRFHDKRGLHDTRSDRRPPSPPPRGRWERDARDRSRSPFRSSSKEYYREPYTDQRRDDKRVGRRDRFDDAY